MHHVCFSVKLKYSKQDLLSAHAIILYVDEVWKYLKPHVFLAEASLLMLQEPGYTRRVFKKTICT